MFTALLHLGPLGFETGGGAAARSCADRKVAQNDKHTGCLQRSNGVIYTTLGGKFAESQPLALRSPSRTKTNAGAVGCGSEKCSQLMEASHKLRLCTAELARPSSPSSSLTPYLVLGKRTLFSISCNIGLVVINSFISPSYLKDNFFGYIILSW